MTPSSQLSAARAFFDPRSIALIGASASATRIGGRTLATLLRHGFPGRIYPVNPGHDEIQGLRAYRQLSDIAEPVDLAVISVPAPDVLGALHACVDKSVPAAVIYSSGFAEAGGDGLKLQDDIRTFVRASPLRVLGPNCLGFMSIPARALCTFGQAPDFGLPQAGGLSIVSQSGAFGTYTYASGLLRRLPISRWITTGNEVDVDFADCVAWLAEDPQTEVILGYMEGCRDGAKLMDALARAQAARKPVVILKVGRTQAGAAAAESHTAALAGNDAVYEAVFRQFGVQRAASVDEFFDIGYAVLRGRPRHGDRVAIVTASGGAGVLIADAASAEGFTLPAVPEEVQNHLKTLVPFAGVRNPIDVTAQVANNPELFIAFFSAVVETGAYDAVFCFQGLSGIAPGRSERLIERWTTLRTRFPDLPIFLSGRASPEIAACLEALQIPIFEDPTRMVRAAAAVRARGEREVSQPLPARDALPPPSRLDWRDIDEFNAANLLRVAGLPMVESRMAITADDAVGHARTVGFPVALKILSPDIAHKSDVGGVVLGLQDAAGVRTAYQQVMQSVHYHQPQARLEGVLISPMVQDGIEAILGARMDPTFGPIVLVGLGGTLVEVLQDVALRVAPFSHEDAHRMLDELRGKALLDGVRGMPAADREALADALVRLGDFAVAYAGCFRSVEINPLRVRAKGLGVLGLDALIT